MTARKYQFYAPLLTRDQFETERNNAVFKVHPMVGLPLNMLSSVLNLRVRRE